MKSGSVLKTLICGRRGGLMVSALDSGARGPGSSPDRGQTQCLSPPRSIIGYRRIVAET